MKKIKNKTKKRTQTEKLFPLWVFDGGDGAGKGTQVELAVKALRDAGKVVTVFDFPQYSITSIGKFIGEALKGVHGNFLTLSSYFASFPFTLDRVIASEAIRQARKKGIVICNRFTPSNVAYQAAKVSGKEQKEFIEFLEHLEYGELGIPKPSMVIYLHVPVEIAQALIIQKDARAYLGGKKGEKDQHEKDASFQAKVIDTYLKLAKGRKDWKVVKCTKGGKILSREAIHKMVMKLLRAEAKKVR